MNIVLIGMRGSGKTTVGGILARKLGRELVEMDDLIVRKAGMSIPEIVARHSWTRFRDIEEELTPAVSRRNSVIISAGGGVVTRDNNIRELKRNGVLVWLNASADSLLGHIGQDPGRPPFVNGRSPRDDMALTLAERESLYQQAADFTVDTEQKTPEAVADEIIGLLKQQGELNDG
jgi:shikimate kinase